MRQTFELNNELLIIEVKDKYFFLIIYRLKCI